MSDNRPVTATLELGIQRQKIITPMPMAKIRYPAPNEDPKGATA